jgi:hypothetical protein
MIKLVAGRWELQLSGSLKVGPSAIHTPNVLTFLKSRDEDGLKKLFYTEIKILKTSNFF